MGTIIKVDFTKGASSQQAAIVADVPGIKRSDRQIDASLIRPASNTAMETELAEEHTSEPIKSIDDINRISAYLVENRRYRDNMLFILGINFGLRVSDLVLLTFNQLIDEDLTFKVSFPILERKTRNTRKVKKNRYITINQAVMGAVVLYLRHNVCKLDDYLFRSESNRGKNQSDPLSRMSVDRIIKGIAEELEIKAKVATHTLRKTFGYHQMVMSGNDPRKLLLLQKIFGHSSTAQTLDYIGITREEIEDAYMSLNLGGRECYKAFSVIQEDERTPA